MVSIANAKYNSIDVDFKIRTVFFDISKAFL